VEREKSESVKLHCMARWPPLLAALALVPTPGYCWPLTPVRSYPPQEMIRSPPTFFIAQLAVCARVAAHGSSSSSVVVERWGQVELNFTAPSTGNPFVDVELGATFVLQEASPFVPASISSPSTQDSTVPLPEPLVSLDFSGGGSDHVPNQGSARGQCPSAQVISAARSTGAHNMVLHGSEPPNSYSLTVCTLYARLRCTRG
jgi:hypothetical protein